MLMLPLAASAQSSETQHVLEAGLRLTPKLDLILHARMRTRPGESGIYQARGGPILDYNVTPKVSLLGGYYLSDQKQSGQAGWDHSNRAFGGAEIDAWRHRLFTADWRSLAERFWGGPDSFFRFRTRLRVVGTMRVAPAGSVETFFDVRGWRSTRYSGTVEVKLGHGFTFEAGYFHEPRRDEGLRHMVQSSLRWRSPRRQLSP
ncbi:MAG TPA: hypothetical protein DEH78_23730 [Solibacterales bacterium]|nr:hypothetical protein [Bryobacterales bacterium]